MKFAHNQYCCLLSLDYIFSLSLQSFLYTPGYYLISPTSFRQYSRCFYHSIIQAWTTIVLYDWNRQAWVFRVAAASRKPHSVLLGFLEVSPVFNVVINISLGFLEWILWNSIDLTENLYCLAQESLVELSVLACLFYISLVYSLYTLYI